MYYEVKVKHNYVNDEGLEKKKTLYLLIDSVSFTEAETKTVGYASTAISGDYFIKSIARSKIEKIIQSETELKEHYFLTTVKFIDDDGKQHSSVMLVNADSPEEVESLLRTALSAWLVEWRVFSVKEIPVDEIIEYKSKEEKES